MENTDKEKIGLSYCILYSESSSVLECPCCSRDIWYSIPYEGETIECQFEDCNWQGEFYDDNEDNPTE